MTNPMGASPAPGGWTQLPMPGQIQTQAPQQPAQPAPAWDPRQSPVQQGQTQFIQTEPSMTMPAPFFPAPVAQQQQQPAAQPWQQQGWPGNSNQVDPRAPQYAPAWQGGQQVPQGGGGQQPQYSQQQRPQQQAPAGVQFDQQGRMFGAGLPAELQGKTMPEALHLYGMMRQEFVQRSVQPKPQPAPQAPPPPASQQLQTQVGQQPRSFWQDPEGVVASQIDAKMQQYLGPVIRSNQEQQISNAAEQVRRLYPNQFAQNEPMILQKMQGLPPETLANPHAWNMALQQVIGEAALRNGGQPQQQPTFQNPQLPWQQAPTPSAAPFHTEAPSGAPMMGGSPQMGVQQLNSAQLEVARRFGFSPEQYVQGMGVRY